MHDSTHFVIAGTAGHIDHGKTALVRALTGVDTDRLKEEKARGISIDLGFAALELPSGRTVGLVDVPGHERFVRNMLAGAGGIDLVVLVVAADEGVMPQTQEHLDIIDLLAVSHGVIVITKADLVEDEDWLELVRLETSELVAKTSLGEAPSVVVSSTSGHGLDELKATLDTMTATIQPRSSTGPLRMPIDRVFTMRGFGTVATGTIWSGQVAVGDTIELNGTGRETRVRTVQVHGNEVERAYAGQRAAIALTGMDKTDVHRGGTMARPGLLEPSYMLDARLRVLHRAPWPLRHRMRVHFHAGTSECLARVVPLESDTIGPGGSGLVQVRLESPVVLLPGDRFVLRSYSPVTTIAGGVVLDPWAAKHRPHKDGTLDGLRIRETGDAAERIAEILRNAGPSGLDPAARALAPIIRDDDTAMMRATDSGHVHVLPTGHLVAHSYRERALGLLDKLVRAHHANFPLQTGFPRGEAVSRLSEDQPGLPASSIVEQALLEGKFLAHKDRISAPEFRVTFSATNAEVRASVLASLQGENRFSPPTISQLAQEHPDVDIEAIIGALLETDEIVRPTRNLVWLRSAMDEVEAGVIEVLRTSGTVTVADLRSRFAMTRKYLIPLLEYLDTVGITRRQGDARVPGPRIGDS